MLHPYSPVAHRSLLAPALGLLGFCGALLAAPAAHAQVIATTPKIEAEAPTNTISGAGAVVATAISGYSGTGYVDYNGENSSVSFPFNATAAGLYEIVIRYESQFDFKLGDLSVNGGPAGQIYYKSTKTSGGFMSTSKMRIQLTAGANTIVLSGGYNYYGIDYIQVAPVATTTTALTPAATTGRVEAEAGQLFYTQALVKDGDAAGSYSGTSYVSSFSENKALGSSITLPVNIATAGVYQIAVGARGAFDDKSFDLSVARGTAAATGKLTTSVGKGSKVFQSFVSGNYNLTAGTNTITITSQTGYLDVDYVDITTTTGVATAARASAEAQKALSAYPNPTNGQALNVSLELDKAQDATFDLVNSLGQRVSTATRSLRAGSNQLQLPTAGVSGGLYQLVVRRGDQPTLVQRVVVN